MSKDETSGTVPISAYIGFLPTFKVPKPVRHNRL